MQKTTIFFTSNTMKDISRKISLAIAAVAAIAVVSSTSSAQYSRTLSLGVSGGAVFPTGDFGDFYSTGFNGTLSLTFKPIGSPLGVRVDGMYNKLDLQDDETITIPGGGDVESASISSANANLVYFLPTTGPNTEISSYLIAGGGIYWLAINGDNFDTDATNNGGVNGGLGVLFRLSGFSTFIEARYHHVFTDGSDTQFIPVTVGISF
jgi:hypothetical protein